MWPCENMYIYIYISFTPTPPRTNMSTEKGPFQKECSSSNHHFSGVDVLVLEGVTLFDPGKSSRGTPSNDVPNKMLEKLLYFSQTLHQPPPKNKKNVPSSVQKKSQKWDLPAFIYIIAAQTETTTSILQLPTATDDPPSLSVNGFTLVLVIRGKDYITP